MKQWILENTSITEELYDSLINPVTVEMKDISEPVTKQPLTDHPIINIDIFTIEPPTEARLKEFDIQKDKEYYIYKNIRFLILAEVLTPLKSILYGVKRFGRCFHISIPIALITPNSKLVTAMCTDIFHINHERFLHTFVTLQDPETQEEYILDGTMNTIMPKEDYLKLFDAQIISEIDKQEFIKAASLFSKLKIESEFSLLEYLCFPKETKIAAKTLYKKRKH